MKADKMLEALKAVATELGVKIRFERGQFSGGYCVLQDKKIIVLNGKLPVEAKAAILARSLGEFDVTTVDMKNEVRDYIDEELIRSEARRKEKQADDLVFEPGSLNEKSE